MRTKLLIFASCLLAVYGLFMLAQQFQTPLKVGASDFAFYQPATLATSTVGTGWAVTPVVSADTSRNFLSLCNDGRSSGQDIYLAFGATTSISSSMVGISVPSNTCYEMTTSAQQHPMFFGSIFAVASPSTSTLLTVTK